MDALEFRKKYPGRTTIILKDDRRIYTTHNGFRYWVVDKNQRNVDEITEAQYKANKKHRVTKKNKR